MSTTLPAYTIERLAPGSYDVLLNGALVAALVREADRGDTAREWIIDLLDEMPTPDQPAPVNKKSCLLNSIQLRVIMFTKQRSER